MRIGELAARTGVSVRSVRYYEQQGLLTSTRSAGGQRHYTAVEVERVGFIQRMFAAGLSSRTIADLLPCIDSPGEETSDAAERRMAQERDRLTGHIVELIRTRDSLDQLIATNRAHRATLPAPDQVSAPPSR
ncbi:MerR family transcriptional regulator [Amycolatopsis mediterranei S699]|uniref:MerR family transcriptional regulator n=2 Tax=Amycolatopsis mediterranei TaxID=33910 RepID=A0A0H3D6H6_AMYMU|nr:MerR family transcriptional regulator [Amycolatopsis mediterranei]ADJ45723.1 MerR family transcriptional regulator [Amycolatopsis mediterranei U32]AEK42505.1 MerR family transcriptional regulator [Amycolatopsis mediterranei S699]AFO77434.1 MerR family transcriptional regulator [Amycolatopsis mediterranei S699]AGT84562.1 MerR family transcriptional regulator [Amycolatopsis mediterranei RB]KDO05770.1 MerR family transcriptional regulator [Amycolatopsis mediterranei]